MSKLVDLDMLVPKVGAYRTGVSAALRDSRLLAIARLRRRQMSQLMTPLDHASSKRRLAPGHYLISLKIDGEFTCMVFRDGEVVSLNPYGTVRAGAPFHVELGRLLAKAGVESAIIGGELWVKRPDGKRSRVHDVTRVARAPVDQADVDSLQFAAFAIYDLDGADLSTAPTDQLARIRQLFGAGQHVKPIPTVEGSESDIQARFREWVELGGEEGVVVRSDKLGWFKIKPRHSLDLAVIGYSHGIEERADWLHSLLLGVVRDDGTFHVVGRTGGGFSDQQRIDMPKELLARVVASSYSEVNSDRVAYKMLEPGLVAQVSCLDLISETSDGGSIDRMVIEWDAAAKSWSGIRRLPFASIISPQFERFRDDKQPSVADTGASQLWRIVAPPPVRPTTWKVASSRTTPSSSECSQSARSSMPCE